MHWMHGKNCIRVILILFIGQHSRARQHHPDVSQQSIYSAHKIQHYSSDMFFKFLITRNQQLLPAVND